MNKGNDSAFFEEFLNHSDSLDFQKVFKVILSRWYWVAGSLFFFGILCFLYLKLTPREYIAGTSLKYSDKQSELDEISSTKPSFLFNNGNTEYLTEKYNIKSQEVVENALIKLDNAFTFYRYKNFRRVDIYPEKPLKIKIIHFDAARFEPGEFSIEDHNQLVFQSEKIQKSVPILQGTNFTIPGLSFLIEEVNIRDGLDIKFVFNNPSILAQDLIKDIEVSEVEEQMPVLTLSFKHTNKTFAKDFLEKLLVAYQDYDIGQKKLSSDLTLLFIRDQVKIHTATLKEAARELEVFKQKNSVFDISTSAAELSEKTQKIEQHRNELEIQKAYITMLEKNLGNTFESVNYLSIGLDGATDTQLIGLLEQFNTLISKRKELLIKYSTNAPGVKNLDEELGKYRKQILDNVIRQKQKNTGIINILDANIKSLEKRFRQIPVLEKNLIYLQSNFEVNKNIYSLLLNKEIESSIVRAGMLPSFKIITLTDADKVSPKPLQAVTLSIFTGLLIGFSSIFLARYFNKTFVRISLIGKSENTAFLGLIHRFPGKTKNKHIPDLSTLSTDRSIFMESIGTLRTRISFIKIDENLHSEKGKQLLITSEKSGEGKTFVSVNLALSLTKIGKKVIIIGCDLRKSKLHHFFGDLNQDGLSLYLQKSTLSKPIKKSTIPNLDYIPAGPPPFNPAELLQKETFQELLSYCRANYDYVILDTAPVGLVADNIPLLTESHVVIFIIRWLFSERESYKIPAQLADFYDVKKINVVVNDFFPDSLYEDITTDSDRYDTYSYYRYEDGYEKKQKRGTFDKIKKKLSVSD